MANKNLNGSQKLKFFDANQIPVEDFYEQERFAAKLKYAKEHYNLTDKLNGIVAHVYTQLEERQSSPNRLKFHHSKLSKQNTSENSKDSKLIQRENKCQRKPAASKPIKNKQKSNVDSVNTHNLSIPRLKVVRSCKEQQKRNSETKSPKIDSNNFDNHKRMEKVLAQQVELEKMLAQHTKIKEHRQSIAQDIFAMRHCLDDVKYRLNNSLKILENKKTYSECHRLAKSLKCKKCAAIEN